MWRHIFTTFMLNWSLVKSCASYHITDSSSVPCQWPAYIRSKITLVHTFFSFKGINYGSCCMNHLCIQWLMYVSFSVWVGFLSLAVEPWWVKKMNTYLICFPDSLCPTLSPWSGYQDHWSWDYYSHSSNSLRQCFDCHSTKFPLEEISKDSLRVFKYLLGKYLDVIYSLGCETTVTSPLEAWFKHILWINYTNCTQSREHKPKP